MILIGIFCDAGPDSQGNERKLTVVINADGEIQDVKIGWLGPKEEWLSEGPTLEISPGEYERLMSWKKD
jgi:hypothetical protein